MSHIIFGDFFSEKTDSLSRKKIEDELVKNGVYIFFDKQMNFYDDIYQMLKEHPSGISNISFCLTSTYQKYNSEDLLYPYDKYTLEELFPDGLEGRRERYEELSLKNLSQLKNSISIMLDIFEPHFFRVFTTSGYDTEFDVFNCTKEGMIHDIFRQVNEGFELRSRIYLLND